MKAGLNKGVKGKLDYGAGSLSFGNNNLPGGIHSKGLIFSTLNQNACLPHLEPYTLAQLLEKLIHTRDIADSQEYLYPIYWPHHLSPIGTKAGTGLWQICGLS